MDRSERDALLAKLADGETTPFNRKQSDFITALVKALSVEEERVIDLGREPRSPSDVFRNPPSFAAVDRKLDAVDSAQGRAPEPDFAAMAHEQYSWSASLDNAGSMLEGMGHWLRANAHRFAAPAPAPAVVRDEAWWLAKAESLREHIRLENWLSIGGMAGWLRSTFAAAPAFDVEALAIKAETMWMDPTSPLTIRECIRVVAREMGLGGKLAKLTKEV
jgi:hypothetical protein